MSSPKLKCGFCDFVIPRVYRNKRGKIRYGVITLKDHFMRRHVEEAEMLIDRQITEIDSDLYFEEISKEESLMIS